MSFLKNIFNFKKVPNSAKSDKNIKKIKKNKEENKSPDIRKNRKDLINNRYIQIQSPQKRNISKKAIKNMENNNNINRKSTFNKGNDNMEKVENCLKSKIGPMNPNVKKNRNYLKESINEFELFVCNNNIKNDNDVFMNKKDNIQLINDMKPKTNLPKKKRTINNNNEEDKNHINEEINKNTNVKVSLNDNIFFDKEINYNSINNNKEIKPMNNLDKKSYINEDKIIKFSNVLVPLTNFTKENNCFLNVLIQSLFNLNEFREYLLENLYEKAQNEVVKELCELINSYRSILEKNKDNNEKIPATLSVNSLRTYLNNNYGNYAKGATGDPMETLERILDLIHKDYLMLNPSKQGDICNCPSHNFYFLDLAEIIKCRNCHEQDIKSFDKNCYMINIFMPEISNLIQKKNQNFDTYKLNLFKTLKEINETYENENKIKISKCTCKELNYSKEIKLIHSDNPYLIINITWAEEFPNFTEIIKIYCLLPIAEKYNYLFSIDNKDINDTFYIKSIILYGIYHYIYLIYFNSQKRWYIVDDKNIKFIDKYYDLVDYLLRNHLMPVGLIYSRSKNDIIEENEIKNNILSNEEYLKLYKFCEEIENRKELKVDSIVTVEGSFNETNENYLENNIFYNKLFELVNSSSDSDYEECKKKIDDSKGKNKKNSMNNNNINENEKEKDNNDEINNINDDILIGRKYLGDFSRNNIKGGLIMFSTTSCDIEGKEKQSQNDNICNKNEDENKKYLGLGKNHL